MTAEGATTTGSNASTTATTSPETIAVIGGGPGAMFLCHALETQKKELESKGQHDKVSSFPIVTCFERSEGPGGVWRSDRTHEDGSNQSSKTPLEETTNDKSNSLNEDSQQCKKRKVGEHSTPNMYSGLWTNGSKEMYEMYDYTFKDHFGDVRMPTHLPRQHVLGYLLARVTRNCPDFFERYFSFGKTVQNVRYLGDDDTKTTESEEQPKSSSNHKFRVSIFDEATGMEDVKFFDKCIWAGGVNGIPKVPTSLLELFEEGGFPGRIVHSFDTSNFKKDVQGKNVLMVGGGCSAEDLALMAIKEGVSKVYCSFRFHDCELAETTRWPYDKVVSLSESAVESVKGSEVTLGEVYYNVKKAKYIFEKGGKKTILPKIDTVIFCTGYKYNVNMLDEALQDALPKLKRKLPVSPNWTMKENDYSQTLLGDGYRDIRPKNNEVVKDRSLMFFPHSKDLYKATFVIDNPKMMYLQEYGETPLMSLEVHSWMVAKILSRQIPLPSPDEMRADNMRIVGECLQCPTLRFQMDWKYQVLIDNKLEELDDEEEEDRLWKEAEELADTLPFRLQGEIMNHFQYPVSYLCRDGNSLSEYGKSMRIVQIADSRDHLKEVEYDTDREPDGWRSFRDNPKIEDMKSYFTGIRSKLLPKPWVELDANEKLW